MIRLQNVSKHYGAFRAIRNADLEIAPGQLVALVGRSGSGKSTLLNLLGGIDAPTEGSVIVAGSAIERLGGNALSTWRGANVGFVFQFFQLLPTLTAIENVMLPMDFHGAIPGRERRPRALTLLDRVGVADQAEKLPATLSGGQQQRVAIARALANSPRLILADEPTGNLDSTTAAAVLELFRALATGGTTVVIATHERNIPAIADRTIELADGAIVSAALRESAVGAAP